MIGRRATGAAAGTKRKRPWRPDLAAGSCSGSSEGEEQEDGSRHRVAPQGTAEHGVAGDAAGAGNSCASQGPPPTPNDGSPDSRGAGVACSEAPLGQSGGSSPSEARRRKKAFAWMDSGDESAAESESANFSCQGPGAAGAAGGEETQGHQGVETVPEQTDARSPARGAEEEGGKEEGLPTALEPLRQLEEVQTFSEFVRLAPSLRQGVGDMTVDHIVTLCKAASRVRYFDSELFAEVFKHLIPRIKAAELGPAHITDIVQCLTDLNACDVAVVAAAAAMLTPRVADLDKAQRLRWLNLLADVKSPHCEVFVAALRSAPVPEDLSPVASASGRIACRHFARGFCAMGKTCTFSHEAGLAPPPPTNPLVLTQMQHTVHQRSGGGGLGFGKPPCRHFLRGFCTLGAGCSFRHGDACDADADDLQGLHPLRCGQLLMGG